MVQYKKYLAIDFGTVRVGLAVSRGSLAEPLQILANDESLLTNIATVIEREKIEEIVVGISENEMAEKTRAFIKQLASQTHLPIIMEDETLSSKTVHEKLKSSKKSKRAGNIDHFAAAEFLQEFLETNSIN